MLAYSFHILIFSLCALADSDLTDAVKLPLGYVSVAPGFVGTGNSVLPDCVVYMLGCDEIDTQPYLLPTSLLYIPDVYPLT